MITRDLITTSYEYLAHTKTERSYASLVFDTSGDGNVREQLVNDILKKIYGEVLASIESADSLGALVPLVAKLRELIGEPVESASVIETLPPVPVVELEAPPATVPVVEPEVTIAPVVEPVIETVAEATIAPVVEEAVVEEPAKEAAVAEGEVVSEDIK